MGGEENVLSGTPCFPPLLSYESQMVAPVLSGLSLLDEVLARLKLLEFVMHANDLPGYATCMALCFWAIETAEVWSACCSHFSLCFSPGSMVLADAAACHGCCSRLPFLARCCPSTRPFCLSCGTRTRKVLLHAFCSLIAWIKVRHQDFIAHQQPCSLPPSLPQFFLASMGALGK